MLPPGCQNELQTGANISSGKAGRLVRIPKNFRVILWQCNPCAFPSLSTFCDRGPIQFFSYALVRP